MGKIITLIFTSLLTIGSLSGYLFVNSKISVGEKLLSDGQKQYDAGQKKLQAGKAQLAAGKQKLGAVKTARNQANYLPFMGQVKSSIVGRETLGRVDSKIANGDKQVADGEKQVRAGEAKLAAGKKALAKGGMQLAQAKAIRLGLGAGTWVFAILTVLLGVFWRRAKK